MSVWFVTDLGKLKVHTDELCCMYLYTWLVRTRHCCIVVLWCKLPWLSIVRWHTGERSWPTPVYVFVFVHKYFCIPYFVFMHCCIVRLWWVSIVGREAQPVDHWHASRPFQFPEKSHSAEKDFRGKTGFPWTKNHRHVKKEFLSADRIFLWNLCHSSKDSKYRNLF